MNITNLDIKQHINTYYRSYAIYVIESRGIPNFYDSLTPVQRLILLNAPEKFDKTIAVIGKVLGTKLYHHGEMSLTGAINKLARPFACAEQMLLGDGFFGSPVSPRPSASRYTEIKIAKPVSEHIERYAPINVKNDEGGYDWLHLDEPIGLMTHVVGIAVGYASNILPRKPSDVLEYLEGKPKQLKPYFKGFNGKITKHKDVNSGWIIEGEVLRDNAKMTIHITSLPPLMRYDSFIKRLFEKVTALGDHAKIDNNSTTDTNLSIKWTDSATWTEFADAVDKMTKIAAVESLIFVKDGVVVVYDQLSDYLDEFKVHRQRVIHRKMEYDLSVMNDELDYLRAKLAFLRFMMAKKRKNEEIKLWMKDYSQKIRSRLDNIKLTALTEETVRETEVAIQDMIRSIAEQKKTVSVQLAVTKQVEKDFKGKGKVAMAKASPLFDAPVQSLDGIELFAPEEEEGVPDVTDEDEDDETI